MSLTTKAIIAGLVTGILGMVLSVLPFGLDLDENVGLDLLYKLRGTRKAPSDVIVVSIDKASSEKLEIPADPEKWPRALHARLTENLARKGASVVAFDLFFEEARSKAEDEVFATAIRSAQNVVLSEKIALEDDDFADAGEGMHAVSFRMEYPLKPIDLLAQSALALAPFPLPKGLFRVNQYWGFKKSAGDIPTLPVVVFQVYALKVYDDFIYLLKQVDPHLAEQLPGNKDAIVETKGVAKLIRTLRDAFQNNPALAEGMLEKIHNIEPDPSRERDRQILLSLIRMYQGPNSHHINFYGPPGTITTVGYHEALGDPEKSTAGRGPIDFKGKAVFIGLSERLRPVEKDGFPTVYSPSTGFDTSGVEIAATAFTNLLEDMPVQPLTIKAHTAVMVLWGVLMGVLCCSLPAATAAVCMLGLGAIYLFIAQYQFSQTGMWYPLVFPLGFQIPFAFFGILICKYFETDKQRVKIRKAFEYFVPSEVVDHTATNPDDLKKSDEIVHGICLYTDAAKYTTLSESMKLEKLSALMDKYYEEIFRPLKKYGGQVVDIKGDSVLAVWKTEEPDAALRTKACLAALDIANAASETMKIPTRIGLHYGQIFMGSKGFGDHFEYRTFGDTVNTASRIEGLNKYLGTQILASEEVLKELDGFITRDLGKIRPAGKSRSISIYELMCRIEDCDEEQKRHLESFAMALEAFKRRLWNEAIEIFEESMHLFGRDGPSNFYLNKCEQYKENPPEETWDGVVDLDEK